MVSLLAAGQVAAAPRLVHETGDGVEALAVDYRDLDLSSPVDAAALIARLRSAADLVCRAGAPATPMTLGVVQTYRSCTHAALRRALQAVAWPTAAPRYAVGSPMPPTQLR